MPDSIEPFLERVAAATPTPGGGSVSAVCGALSAALSRMVANLAIGKEGYEEHHAHLTDVEVRGKALQTKFLVLAGEDARAYDGVIQAMRMPKATDEERAFRKEAMQVAYRKATEIPMETIRTCIDALELARMAAERGSRSAITDVGMAAILAQAAMRGAGLNVRINLAAVADERWRQKIEEELYGNLGVGAGLAHRVDDIVDSKM